MKFYRINDEFVVNLENISFIQKKTFNDCVRYIIEYGDDLTITIPQEEYDRLIEKLMQ